MESGFPKLVFSEHGDGSWERFIEEMNLCIESAVERRGYKGEGGNRRLIMRGRAKLRPLLRAIGHSGREVLRGAGFNVDGINSTYEGAVEVLQDYYDRQESMFVKGHKFLTARQALGESDREYLQRVESLSRYAEVTNNNDRVRFALIVAVNGLRDREVSRDLMKNANLTWVMLNEALRAREIANHSDRFVRADSRGCDLKSEIKKKVGRVSECDSRAQYRSNGKDGSYDSVGRPSPRGNPRSSRRYYGSEEHDTSEYGTRGWEYNKDSRKYRDNSRERHVSRYRANSREGSEDRVCYNCRHSGHEMRSCPSIKCFSCGRRGHVSRYCRDKGDVGYDRRGSSRRSGGSRDSSYERYGSRDISRERCRGQESPREMRDKSSRYRDKSMDRFEGEKYKERRKTSRYDEGYQDNSKGRSVRFSGYRDKYGEDQ
ncbi:uncharacterized protein DDB_G0287625-like [Watersipora subatra]|uniref:uncharacterized protein DDB_G0287625-like n=1 Tax=Watersipora subatra TaxID=2589382 RepID=UPI00355C8210